MRWTKLPVSTSHSYSFTSSTWHSLRRRELPLTCAGISLTALVPAGYAGNVNYIFPDDEIKQNWDA